MGEPASIQSMFFEKKSFFYWLEDGIIELSVESKQPGKWKTLDNNISAQENVHYKSSNGSIDCGYNVIEINILMHDTTEDPVGFGIQVENEIGEIIQTCVILQPFQ